MYIHLFTSSKGGVGKTMLATAAASYYLTNKKVLCLDLNWENPDFSTIMSFGDEFRFLGNFGHINFGGGNGRVLRPTSLYTIPQGAPGFWALLYRGIQEAKERHHDPDHVIVDTGMHLGNLVKITKSGVSDLVRMRFKKLWDDHKVEGIYVWFLWTPAAFYRDEDGEAIRETLETLVTISDGEFIPDKHLINILNPYALLPNLSLKYVFQRITNKPNTQVVNGLLQLAKSKSVNGINLEQFRKLIDGHGIGDGLLDSISVQDKFLDILAKAILKNFGGRPRNIFPLPLFDINIFGITDVYASRIPFSSVADIPMIFGKSDYGNLDKNESFDQNPKLLNVLSYYLNDL